VVWDQDFDAYLTFLDETPASFIVDLAAAAHGPVEALARRIQIRVPLLEPRDDGLRDASEVELLARVEDGICELLEQRCGARFLGHVISEGVLHVVCYADGARIDDEASLLDGLDAGGYDIAWLVEDDPEWEMYFEFLFPDPLDFQLIQNRRMLERFADEGDQLSAERIVDHAALFDDRSAIEPAAAALREEGFEVDEPILDEGMRWVLGFHRPERLDEGRTDGFCLEILELLEPFDCLYDGWGAPLIREPDTH